MINKAIKFINLFWAVPIVLVIRLFRPWINIRIGTIKSDRIGHFVDDAGQQWAELSEKSSNQIDLYWLDKQTSNQQWAKMVRRNFKVAWWVRYLDHWNNVLPGGEDHHRPSTNTSSRDTNGIINRTKISMKFLSNENQRAKSWLILQGWKEGEPFACLLVRDNAFLDSDPLTRSYRGSWGYHSHRNSDIDTYVPAMEWLADQGVWVFRMGKIMEKPILSQHKRIIDYASHPEKSDFLDIWLFAHCNLCISTSCGLDAVSSTYRRPILLLNFIPLFSNFWSWSNAIHFPKLLIWKTSGKLLNWKEYLQHFYYRNEQYQNAGIKIIDLTPKEILHATQECWQRLEGNWVDTEDDLKKHQQFWDILMTWSEFSNYHGWKHPNSRIGTTWLRNHSEVFGNR